MFHHFNQRGFYFCPNTNISVLTQKSFKTQSCLLPEVNVSAMNFQYCASSKKKQHQQRFILLFKKITESCLIRIRWNESRYSPRCPIKFRKKKSLWLQWRNEFITDLAPIPPSTWFSSSHHQNQKNECGEFLKV